MAYLRKILTTPGRYFIVVGAAHMVGRYGLPGWLKYQGYQVQQQ